jgi:hypothetical protein
MKHRKLRINPNSPKSLQRDYHRLRSCQKVADLRRVNVAHVHRALTKGIRPSNPNIARRLGFDKIADRFGDHRTRHMRAWNKLSPQQKHQIVFDWYHHAYANDERKQP